MHNKQSQLIAVTIYITSNIITRAPKLLQSRKRMKLTLSITFSLLVALLLTSVLARHTIPSGTVVNYPNRIILIRHAEKGFTPGQKRAIHKRGGWHLPPWFPGGGGGGGPEGGRFPNGLSEKGKKRAQFLRTVSVSSKHGFLIRYLATSASCTSLTDTVYSSLAKNRNTSSG